MLVRAREYTCEGAHVRACVSRCVCERVCVIGRAWHYTGEPEASAVPKGRHPPRGSAGGRRVGSGAGSVAGWQPDPMLSSHAQLCLPSVR